LTRQILEQDSMSTKQQLQQAKQSYTGSQNALTVMRKKVGDLIVRAPIDGQLTSLDAEIGQTKREGDRLGQIDVLSGFKVRVDVDEHYLSRIFTGLTGDFTFAIRPINCGSQKCLPGHQWPFPGRYAVRGRSAAGHPSRANPADPAGIK
jgi:multidrug resistance efflux pump